MRDTGCFVARRRRFGISAGSRSSTLPKPSSGSAARRNMYVSNNSRLRHRTFLPASVPACVCHHPPLTSSSSHVHKPFCGNFHSLSALLWQLPLFVCPAHPPLQHCYCCCVWGLVLPLLTLAAKKGSQETKNLRRRMPQTSPRCRHCRRRRRRPPAAPAAGKCLAIEGPVSLTLPEGARAPPLC